MSIAERICLKGNRPKKMRMSTEVSISTAVERLDIITKAVIIPTGSHKGKIVSLKVSFLP